MRPVKTVMVCLDLTEMDDMLIRYSIYFSQLLGEVGKIIFAHNIKFDYPEEAGALIDRLDKPLGELIGDIITEKVTGHFEAVDPAPSFEVVVKEDASTAHALAELAEAEGVDLTISGKKISYQGSGLVAESLLRIADFHSDLLLVPETAFHQISNIVVATDFSEASKAALERGLYIQKQTKANLNCQHVFSIPAHYFPYIPVGNMQKGLRQNAEERWEEFVETHDLADPGELECALVFNDGKSTAQTIYDYALREKKDLIVIGSKGKGALTTIVLGSVAVRLVQADSHIPLWVTR
jgi:nucleotide-binding universal stress UspA family protein